MRSVQPGIVVYRGQYNAATLWSQSKTFNGIHNLCTISESLSKQIWFLNITDNIYMYIVGSIVLYYTANAKQHY